MHACIGMYDMHKNVFVTRWTILHTSAKCQSSAAHLRPSPPRSKEIPISNVLCPAQVFYQETATAVKNGIDM